MVWEEVSCIAVTMGAEVIRGQCLEEIQPYIKLPYLTCKK